MGSEAHGISSELSPWITKKITIPRKEEKGPEKFECSNCSCNLFRPALPLVLFKSQID